MFDPSTLTEGNDNWSGVLAIDDYIRGLGGADIMNGGLGDDFFSVDNAGDKVIEGRNQGYDTVYSTVTFSLAGQYGDKLVLANTDPINGTGNSLDNAIIGNDGDNRLAGGSGVCFPARRAMLEACGADARFRWSWRPWLSWR